jgi:hypothetical protein
MLIEDNVLNDEWINNFENSDKLYQDFYKDDLYYVNLKFIYINRTNEIEKITTESLLLSTPNYISREEIIKILKNASIDNSRMYSLFSILKYNITLDAGDIKTFINSSNQYTDFLKVIRHIDRISFDKTISMMQDLNEIILIFYEKSKELKKANPHNISKKHHILYLNAHKKTIKKQYKD